MQKSDSMQDIKGQILAATGRLLLRYGYKRMTVDDIAHEAGIGKGTIYLHFTSKSDVALQWLGDFNVKLRAELKQIADSDLSPIERIRQILTLRVLRRFDSAIHFAESFDELFAALRPALLEARVRNHKEEAFLLAKVIQDGCAAGVFRCDDVADTAYCLVLATNSLLPYSLSAQQLGEREEIECYVMMICDLVTKGVVSR
ncbi:MAG: TetR/AcrR family transcriptional regulator [Armatimonadota bacterium]